MPSIQLALVISRLDKHWNTSSGVINMDVTIELELARFICRNGVPSPVDQQVNTE